MMSMNLNDGNEPVIDDAYICRISIESDKCEKFTCSKLAWMRAWLMCCTVVAWQMTWSYTWLSCSVSSLRRSFWFAIDSSWRGRGDHARSGPGPTTSIAWRLVWRGWGGPAPPRRCPALRCCCCCYWRHVGASVNSRQCCRHDVVAIRLWSLSWPSSSRNGACSVCAIPSSEHAPPPALHRHRALIHWYHHRKVQWRDWKLDLSNVQTVKYSYLLLVWRRPWAVRLHACPGYATGNW